MLNSLHQTLDMIDKVAAILNEYSATDIRLSLPQKEFQETLGDLTALGMRTIYPNDVKDWYFRYHTPHGVITVVAHD